MPSIFDEILTTTRLIRLLLRRDVCEEFSLSHDRGRDLLSVGVIAEELQAV